jgi:hypothetical protein
MSSVRNFGRVRYAANHYVGALVACVGASVVSLAGCFTVADGVPPPLDQFYYPTALVVSPGRTTLYVVNSDFDLQYSGGTVQALDLGALRTASRSLRVALNEGAAMEPPRATKDTCELQGLKLSAYDETALYPGPCSPVVLDSFVKNAVVIGAFASAATLAVRPCSQTIDEKSVRGARLFVAVRGDPSVTYFDVTDDREKSCGTPAMPLAASSPCADPLGCLSCGATTNGGRCAKSFIIGEDPTESERGLKLEVDPYGIDVDDRGESIVVAHQTQQTASLVVNNWGGVPKLEYALTNMSPGPTDIVSLPIPLLVEENRDRIGYTPAFAVSYRSAPEFTLLRFQDSPSGPQRPFLTRGASTGVATTASSTDSRGVAIDGTERRACEETCVVADRNACLRACAENHPLSVYMANRGPAALVVGRIETKFTEGTAADGTVQVTGAYEVPTFHDSVPLAFGTSHVELGYVVDTQGRLSRRIFAVAFDSRFVFSYDPDLRRIDAIIRTGRGPHAITFDNGEELGEDGLMHPYATMYVSHFTDSYVGVVDLDMNNRTTFGSIYMTLGKPVPPKGSQ